MWVPVAARIWVVTHSYDLQVNKKAYPHKGADMLWFPFSVNLHRDYGLLLSRGVLLIVGLWVFVSSFILLKLEI